MNHEQARQRELSLEKWLHSAVQQHENLLVRYGHQFTGDLDRARDVVQDTFIKLCNEERVRLSDGRPRLQDTDLTKWLYRVCRNRAIDVSRKEKRMQNAPLHQFAEQVASTRSPDESLLAEERHLALMALI